MRSIFNEADDAFARLDADVIFAVINANDIDEIAVKTIDYFADPDEAWLNFDTSCADNVELYQIDREDGVPVFTLLNSD